MAEAIMLGQGGLVNSDNVSVTKDKVIENKTYMGSDTDDEIGVGTMPDHAARTTSPDLQVAGSSLVAHIPFGAYRENAASGYPELTSPISVLAPTVGLTSAKIMAGQTAMSISGTATNDANVVANRMLSGYSAYAKGQKINGTLAPTSIYNLSLFQWATNQIGATWNTPNSGPWSGVRIMAKQGSYPTSPTDGVAYYEGAGNSHIGNLNPGTWYFRAWNYITTNFGRVYGGYVQSVITTSSQAGTAVFTAGGTFVVPNLVRYIDVFGVGGGGHGGGGALASDDGGGGGGGGAGYTQTALGVAVTPGQTISITVGAGGGADGGNTVVQGIMNVSGGKRGYNASFNAQGGAGGSGGGTGGVRWDSHYNGGNGGADGSDGEAKYYPGGKGQNYTTRAFGESGGTLYAGGGGAGASNRTNAVGGAGGAGGGGRGSSYYPSPATGVGTPGAPNTGGGGGGNGGGPTSVDEAHPGGSGIVIIRWG